MLAKHLIENGHPIDQMVNLWSSGGAGALDYGAVNLGQLKKVAAPFYDQLIFLGLRLRERKMAGKCNDKRNPDE